MAIRVPLEIARRRNLLTTGRGLLYRMEPVGTAGELYFYARVNWQEAAILARRLTHKLETGQRNFNTLFFGFPASGILRRAIKFFSKKAYNSLSNDKFVLRDDLRGLSEEEVVEQWAKAVSVLGEGVIEPPDAVLALGLEGGYEGHDLLWDDAVVLDSMEECVILDDPEEDVQDDDAESDHGQQTDEDADGEDVVTELLDLIESECFDDQDVADYHDQNMCVDDLFHDELNCPNHLDDGPHDNHGFSGR